MDLSRRATDPELLDEGVPEAEALESLADLRRVNRWLGTHGRILEAGRPFLEAVRPLQAPRPAPRLLAVGGATPDVSDRIRRSFPRPLLAVGVDIKLLHLQAGAPEVRRVVGDAMSLPFGDGTFDVVLASHFLHHFDGAEAVTL